MIQETSRAAFQRVKEHLNERQAAVLDFIKANGAVCNYDIAAGLGWDINRVTPRTLELRKMNLILACGVRASKTGRAAHFWRCNDVYGLPRFVQNPSAPVTVPVCFECPPRGCGVNTQNELFSKNELKKTQRIEDVYA